MIYPSSFTLHPSAFLFATTVGAGFEPKFWWLIGAWIALMGAFFGSFMNVVVYRLPAGKRLAYPGSACPFCGHAVRWFDNVPVLSWLVLRGRCRDCRRHIAGRYPFVEHRMIERRQFGVRLFDVRRSYRLLQSAIWSTTVRPSDSEG